MSQFTPDQPKEAADVPWFEDVSADQGWQGQTTKKSVEALKSEITQAFGRLGGMVTGFVKGTFQINGKRRDGYRITYMMESRNGGMIPGHMDVAALPVRPAKDARTNEDAKREKSLKMMLYMLREALNGQWFLQQMSPGFAALMPFLLAPGRKETITELWNQSGMLNNLLPAGQVDEFIDGEVKEVK